LVPTPTPERPTQRKRPSPSSEFVFDPVIGVVPKELAKRWESAEKQQQTQTSSPSIKNHIVPPVRYQN